MSQLEFTSGSAEPSATQFVDVILPLPLPNPFTYRVPNELQNQVIIGSRVVVPFGNRKVHTGIIKEVHNRPPKQYEARYLIDLLDTSPSLNPTQLRFFQWMAGYYLCNLGEVVNNALPSGLKISNESFIQLHPNYVNTDEVLSWEEELVLQQLETGETYAYEALGELVGASKVSKVIKALIDRQAIIIFDHIKERYVPKIEKKIRLNAELIHDNQLEEVFKQLDKKPKQTDVLLSFLQRVAIYDEPALNEEGVARKELLKANISPSSLNTLIKNKILEEFSIQVSRFDKIEPTKDRPQLSLSQSQARNEVLDQFRELKTVLLQGITGSGKTEIYIDLIAEVLESGSQALYLLPEIALTTQIVERVKKVFGDKVGVYHSRFSDNERVEVWQGVQSGKYDFVIGVRSAIFLPFENLELIVIDEEHESSYKQHDPAPRYHARDSALVLASYHQAKVLLGSATPSIESKYLATQGKYGFVELNDRFADSSLPNITLVNIAKEKKKKKMHGNFSASLIDALNATFKKKEQAIIFQNRRGYAPYLNCNMCGWIPQCDNCSVSLTYHMYQNELKCHYCGFRAAVPTSCEICGAHEMQAMSFGTEQLEEELKLLYPDKRIERMDLDTMKAKTAYEQLITNFTEREIDVIVGTQMVAKGLDFEHVSLVGILDIDRMIHFPDFRAQERAFDISVQVAGRAGRRKTQGEVLIQTFDPEQAILQKVVNHDYNGFYKVELAERKAFFYPPFSRMIKIVLKHRALDVCLEASYKLAQLFRDTIGDKRVFGPAQPIISKIRNRYLQEVYVKIERSANLKKAKLDILEQVNVVKSDQKLKGLRIVVDVDPI